MCLPDISIPDAAHLSLVRWVMRDACQWRHKSRLDAAHWKLPLKLGWDSGMRHSIMHIIKIRCAALEMKPPLASSPLSLLTPAALCYLTTHPCWSPWQPPCSCPCLPAQHHSLSRQAQSSLPGWCSHLWMLAGWPYVLHPACPQSRCSSEGAAGHQA